MCGNDPAESVRARTPTHPAHDELGRDCGCVVGVRGKHHGRIAGSNAAGQPQPWNSAGACSPRPVATLARRSPRTAWPGEGGFQLIGQQPQAG